MSAPPATAFALTAIAGIGYPIDAFGTFLADYSLNVRCSLLLVSWC